MAMHKPGDLVWAKMKGFPPWPAMVLSTTDVPMTCPSGKHPVLFFGTNESALMKPSDLYAYRQYREQNEQPRKIKKFNQAIKEIRREAGIEEDADFEKKFPIEIETPSATAAKNKPKQPRGRPPGTPKSPKAKAASTSTPTTSKATDEDDSDDDMKLSAVASSPASKTVKKEESSQVEVLPDLAAPTVPPLRLSLPSPSELEGSGRRRHKPKSFGGEFMEYGLSTKKRKKSVAANASNKAPVAGGQSQAISSKAEIKAQPESEMARESSATPPPLRIEGEELFPVEKQPEPEEEEPAAEQEIQDERPPSLVEQVALDEEGVLHLL